MAMLSFVSCSIEKVEPSTIIGEWRYVGKFNHKADYKCIVCDNYDYENEKYRIKFLNEGVIEGQVNILILKGNYKLKENQISIENFERLNKPAETAADGSFIENFKNSNSYSVGNMAGQYQYLQVEIPNENFLYFIRK